MYLVSPLPSESSPATQRIKASFGESSSVNFEHCLYRAMHTQAASSYIIRSEQTGSRTVVNYNDLPEMTVDEFEGVVRRFSASDETWWHFEVSPSAAFLKWRPRPLSCQARDATAFDPSTPSRQSLSDNSSSGPDTQYYIRVHPQAA